MNMRSSFFILLFRQFAFWSGYGQKISSCIYSSRSRTISEWQNTRCIILFVSSKLYEENIMKKYLFGLGAMLVGAGLMFVFTHTQVSADEERKEVRCQDYKGSNGGYYFEYCKFDDVTCVFTNGGISCVKSD